MPFPATSGRFTARERVYSPAHPLAAAMTASSPRRAAASRNPRCMHTGPALCAKKVSSSCPVHANAVARSASRSGMTGLSLTGSTSSARPPTNAAGLALAGLLLGVTRDRRWLLLPGIVLPCSSTPSRGGALRSKLSAGWAYERGAISTVRRSFSRHSGATSALSRAARRRRSRRSSRSRLRKTERPPF